jgi:hypothetical protein
MANEVTKQIIEEVKCVKYYYCGLHPRHTACRQTCSYSWVSKRIRLPVEQFLLFLPNTGHNSKQLFQAVFSILEMYDFKIANCRGQMYENTPNMAAVCSGLQTRITEQPPVAVYIPFSAHSLNFTGHYAAICCKEATAFSVLLQNLYMFFTASTQMCAVLQNNITQHKKVGTVIAPDS